MARCQRRIALRVASAYQTISSDALQVLSGIVPIELLAAERAEIHTERTAGGGNLAEVKAQAKRRLVESWQSRWATAEKGEWMRRLIPQLAPWLARSHGHVTYHITQAFSGHGCFAGYLHRFSLLSSAECWFCSEAIDDARHTLFQYSRWEEDRSALVADVGEFDPDTITEKMLLSQHNWSRITAFITDVLKQKKRRSGSGSPTREGREGGQKNRRKKKRRKKTFS